MGLLLCCLLPSLTSPEAWAADQEPDPSEQTPAEPGAPGGPPVPDGEPDFAPAEPGAPGGPPVPEGEQPAPPPVEHEQQGHYQNEI